MSFPGAIFMVPPGFFMKIDFFLVAWLLLALRFGRASYEDSEDEDDEEE